MKRIYIIAIVSFLVIASLGISIYQYIATTKADLANAASTKPANGHSWAEMESDSDSIQVSGQTITNLIAPVNASDATNKSYVDAASGVSLYDDCYVIRSLTTGITCAAEYTTVFSYNYSTLCWTALPAFGGTGTAFVTFGLAGAPYTVGVGSSYDAAIETAHTPYGDYGGCVTVTCQGLGSRCVPFIYLNGDGAYGPQYNTPQSFAYCCK